MKISLPNPQELSSLLRLLDDETPAVRQIVAKKFEDMAGDLSELLPSLEVELDENQKKLLAEMLLPGRRQALRDDWITPGYGAASLSEDWELFENHLRLISDFLHDGLTIRQSLSDALDLLAEEAEEENVSSADELRIFLFENGRLKPNLDNYYDFNNSDLAWCLMEGVSNPIGLSVIYMLVGQRLDLEIEGISYPGHFLCRIYEDGFPKIVDCYDKGCIHSQTLLTAPNNDLSQAQRRALESIADLGTILLRILNNLIDSFQRKDRVEDAALFMLLRDSMIRSRNMV